MASSIGSEKLGANLKVVGETITGGTTVVGTYQDLRDFETFGALVTVAALTGAGVTKVELVAADDASGTNITVIKDSGTVAANAVDDQVFEECTVPEIAQLSAAGGLALRYGAVRVTLANAADVAVANIILGDPRHAATGLTPATTIA